MRASVLFVSRLTSACTLKVAYIIMQKYAFRWVDFISELLSPSHRLLFTQAPCGALGQTLATKSLVNHKAFV